MYGFYVYSMRPLQMLRISPLIMKNKVKKGRCDEMNVYVANTF